MKQKKSDDLVNLGFNYRLPREWFLSDDDTKTVYANEYMFGQFGRNIALGERKYLNDQIMDNPKITWIKIKDSSTEKFVEGIRKAISVISDNKSKPVIIFPTIPHLLKLHKLSRANGKASLKYSASRPKPALDPSLFIDNLELKIINPLGKIPTQTIIFGQRSVRCLLRRYPKYGSLYIDMGNDRFYPDKFVEVIAITTVKFDISPEGIAIVIADES